MHFSCLVSAIPAATVEWALDGIRLRGSSRVTIDRHGSRLTVHNVTTGDAGNYSCSATNGYGNNVTAVGQLRVQGTQL